MRCSCTIFPRDTLPEEEEGGANVNGAERDGVEREEGAVEFDCRNRSWASLRLTVAYSMAHMTVK